MSWFSDEAQAFLAWALGVGKLVLGLVFALGKAMASAGGPVLAQAAMDGVLAAEAAGGTGAEKLAAAQAAVIADLTSKGIPTELNAINGAIEAAVAKMKADQAKTASPTPVSDASAAPVAVS